MRYLVPTLLFLASILFIGVPDYNIGSGKILSQSYQQYAGYNGFIGITNIVEVVNAGNDISNVSLEFFSNEGVVSETLEFELGADQQRDIILNNLKSFKADTYGLIRIISSDPNVQGRVSYYRSSKNTSQEFDFAFSTQLQNGKSGDSFVTFNTFDPRNTGAVTANWLTLVNLNSASSKTFRIQKFSHDGKLIGIEKVFNLKPFERKDIDGGHEIPGPDQTGLIKISPEDPNSAYMAQLLRYGTKVGSSDFTLAFPLEAKAGSNSSLVVPLNTSVYNGAYKGFNWLEVVNVENQKIQLIAKVYSKNGTLLKTLDFYIEAYSQRHLPTFELLGQSESLGSVRLEPSAGKIIAQSVFYEQSSVGKAILGAYPMQGEFVSDLSNEVSLSWNRYIEMENFLTVMNLADSFQTINFSVQSLGGGRTEYSKEVGPNGMLSISLNDNESGTRESAYGTVVIKSAGKVFADLLRARSVRKNELNERQLDFFNYTLSLVPDNSADDDSNSSPSPSSTASSSPTESPDPHPSETPPSSPSVTTAAVTSVSATAALSGGNVLNTGGSPITGRGVCWSTSPNPTISDSRATAAGGTGLFVTTLGNLIPSTSYFVRAYATNAVGTSYGAQQTFTSSPAATGNHAHFLNMKSHPNHHFSTSLRTAESVIADVEQGLNGNKSIDLAEDALRFKAYAGARDILQPGEMATISNFAPILRSVDGIISVQFEVKLGNTGSAAGKTFNWRTIRPTSARSSITWETNLLVDSMWDNDSEWGAGLFPVASNYRNPGFSSATWRLYNNGTLNAPMHGYPGTSNPDRISVTDSTGVNFQPGGQTAYYDGSNAWVMSPDMHFGQSKTGPGGTQPFIFKTGIWYRFTQSVKYLGNDNWQMWVWVSSEQDDPVLLVADKDNPNNGYPVYGWNFEAFQAFLYEWNGSSAVAGQDQYYWGRNVIVFNGAHVPLGGRPNNGSAQYIAPTAINKMARGHANFGVTNTFSIPFINKTTASRTVVDPTHSIVAIVTVENAANRSITIADNANNPWQIIEQTPSTQANRVIIAKSLSSNGGPRQVNVSIDTPNAGMAYATIYEVSSGTTIHSASGLSVAKTNHAGPSVSTSKQGLLFGGVVGNSNRPAGFISARTPVTAVASQTQFTIAAGLTTSNIGPNEAVASILYSQEQYSVLKVLSYNTTTGVVVLETPSGNPDNTLTTSATCGLIWKPRYVDSISIDVSPKNWDLFWPVSGIAEGWTSPAPNHLHGVRSVFSAGTWDFPVKSSAAENASTAIVSIE